MSEKILLNYSNYIITSDGKVLDKNTHNEVKYRSLPNGYLYVYIKKDTGEMRQICIHRLVAKAFITNDDPKHKIQIDHINRNKTDNNYTNLRWCTPSENLKNRTMNDIDKIPEDAIEINQINNRMFKNVYYYKGNFYERREYCNKMIRLYTYEKQLSKWQIFDINNKPYQVTIKMFIEEYPEHKIDFSM